MGHKSKIKEQRRFERNQVKELLKGRSLECDTLLNNPKIKSKIYNVNDALKIKNDKPDYLTFYNGDTGEILYTAKGSNMIPDLSGNV